QGRVDDKGTIAATDLTRPFDAKLDLKGPLKVAVAVTVTTKNPDYNAQATGSTQLGSPNFSGRIVAIGSPFFAANQLAQGTFGNGDFFLASVNWLTEDPDLISIPPKTTDTRTIDMLGGTQQKLFYGTVLAPPLALLLLGGMVFWRRR
ncbi:MAG: hypothetical protein KGR26_14305, partial [Cyanobacteria bacterium REEB65]|nr:hypothetical protein [Cyanobacteria bacterium REEB65]